MMLISGLMIYNNDGSESGACGNGTRCVADLILPPDATHRLEISSAGGRLAAWREDGLIAVDMGPPKLTGRKSRWPQPRPPMLLIWGLKACRLR